MNEQKLYFYALSALKESMWSYWAGYIFAPDRERASALLVQKFVYERSVPFDAIRIRTLEEIDIKEGLTLSLYG